MSKLKLKPTSEGTCVARKSDKSTMNTVRSATQENLFNFIPNELDKVVQKSSSSLKNNKSTEETISKYFVKKAETDEAQDQSLLDFHPRKAKNQPKPSLKNNKTSLKMSKKIKHKSCDDLGTYTADFEKVCSTQGVDVNPEHLQMAVAMSLSLVNNQHEVTQQKVSSKTPIEEERIKRIRKTLVEYGFAGAASSSCQDYRKTKKIVNSLLYLRSDEERQQILSNAVSNILLENQSENKSISHVSCVSGLSSNILHEVWCCNCDIFFKSSHSQNLSESSETFYVQNLIVPSNAKAGSLLKDWSKIPGRISSPERTNKVLDYRENDLYKKDLDSLLSCNSVQIHRKINTRFSPVKTTDSNDVCLRTIEKERHLCLNASSNDNDILDQRNSSPDLFEEDSYYEKEEDVLISKTECNYKVIDDLSNDSLPDVYVSQMSRTRIGPTASHQSFSLDKNRKEFSIDLTQNSIEIKSGEPLFIEETDDEESNESPQNFQTNHDLSKENTILEKRNICNTDVCIIEDCSSIDDLEISTNNDNVPSSKQKKIPLDTIENTMRFEMALKEYELLHPVEDGFIDLTNSDLSEKSLSNRLSGIYKNDNGVLHFESYSESDDIMKVHNSPKIQSNECPENGKQRLKIEENGEMISKICIESNSINTSVESNSDNNNQDFIECVKRIENVHNLSDSIFTDDGEHGIGSPNSIGSKEYGGDVMNEKDKINLENHTINVLKSPDVPKEEVDLTQSSDEAVELNFVDEIISFHSHFNEYVSPQKSMSSTDDIFEISDEEFNYSVKLCNTDLVKKSEVENLGDNNSAVNLFDEVNVNNHIIPNDFELYGQSLFDQIPSCNSSTISFSGNKNVSLGKINNEIDPLNMPSCSYQIEDVVDMQKSDIKRFNIETSECRTNYLSLSKEKTKEASIIQNEIATPKNSKYVIKLDNVTPVQDYNKMDTPRVHKELSKYGLKPLKRKRAVQILEHIYNQTHPVVDLESQIKKRKLASSSQNYSSSPKSNKMEKNHTVNELRIIDENIGTSEKLTDDLYTIDRSNVCLRQMDCDKEELFFQTKEKSKIQGCRVPLHIAFHNYVSMRSKLQRALLAYHPINIDMVHKGLVADGYRYNPKELFQFLDKKCITIKTTDKNNGNRKKKR